MKTISHNFIAKLAYEFYLRDGCPQGKDHEHWEEAERILNTEQFSLDEADLHREEGEGGVVTGPTGTLARPLASVLP